MFSLSIYFLEFELSFLSFYKSYKIIQIYVKPDQNNMTWLNRNNITRTIYEFTPQEIFHRYAY